MDVFIIIRRAKTTIFLDVKENTSVSHLKMMIQGVTKRKPEDMKLLKIGSREILEDKKTLAECGFDSQSCKAQDPQTVGLVYRVGDEDEFEELQVEPYSSPPDLPDVMREQQDSSMAGPNGL